MAAISTPDARTTTASPARDPRGRRGRHGSLWLTTGIAAIVALVSAFPLYWMLVTALTPIADLRSSDYSLFPTHPRFSVFTNSLRAHPFGHWYVNSSVIAIAGVVLTVSINLLCGYTFAKMRFPGRDLLFIAIISTLMIPVQVLMVSQFRIIVALGWLNSLWGVIIPRAAEAFGIFLARQYFRTIPDEIIDAARIDGAGELTVFFRVVLPLAKPLIATLVIFTFMWRWNEFLWPLIVLKDQVSYTVPIGLLFLRGQYTSDYNGLMAMTLLSMVPMILVFVLFQRFFVEGMTRSGIK